ncbi:MAG: hypothetical protein M0P61_06725 [Ignavibacteriaceae bacterium]|nr:hypothetical protein [Ignavibacteriaceae bacterium]
MKLFVLIFFFFAVQTFSMSDSLTAKGRSTGDSLVAVDSLKIKSTTVVDSAAVDSLAMQAVKDTIIPLTFSAELPFSSIIGHEEIRRMNLRYAGDLFSLVPVSYKRSLGFSGLPEEMNFYGAGFGNVSYFENGILLNDRTRNVYDLNLYQTEDVDSIELVPSPRAFLHGVKNNLAAVNFITKDFIAMPPYTRLKYIESPFGEGYVDAQFNSLFSKKYLFSFDVSNRKMDQGFYNSDFSLWQAKVKLKYLYSNSLNFFLNYNFVKMDIGLNGGINYDSLATIITSPEKYLYDILTSPVVIRERYQKVKQHNFSARMLAHLYEESTSELSFYYRFNLDEYRQNEFGKQSNLPVFISDRKTKVLGGIISHQTNYSIFNLSLKGNYEHLDYFERFTGKEIINNQFAVDGILASDIGNKNLIPSVFGKIILSKETKYYGTGADVSFLLSENSSLYSGISYFEKVKDDDSILFTSQTIFAAELGYKRTAKNSCITFNLFYNKSGYGNTPITNPTSTGFYPLYSFLPDEETYGAGLTFNYTYWKIHALTNSTFSSKKIGSSNKPYLPNITLNWKVEYRDTLFNSSLRLRTGFEAKYSGRQAHAQYDFYETQVFYNTTKPLVPAWFTLDFYLSGEIQKSAVVYFSWENLFGNNYYVTPYFPMPWRGIRFGISWEFSN